MTSLSSDEPAAGGAARRIARSPYRWAALGVGVVAVSTASILIRLAEAPALVFGAWRMILATLMLPPWAWPRVKREWRGLSRRDWARLALAGAALAIHFASWITSLEYTTVASSVILVSMNPIFVGAATYLVLRERVSAGQVWAIIVALAGTLIVSYGDLALSGRALWGDLVALLGALAAAAYMLLGRALRLKLSTLAYIWPCYGLAALLLAAFALAAGQPLAGYSARTYLVFTLLAVGPQILGHSVFNWALGYFSPIFVTLASRGEPIGATLLALVILRESPPLSVLIGGPLILAAIYLASRSEFKT